MKKRYWYHAVYLLNTLAIALGGCVKKNSSSQATQVIGRDDRVRDDSEWRDGRIGKIEKNGSAICTAFAVGKYEIVSARHCFLQDNKDIVDTIEKFSFVNSKQKNKMTRVIEEYPDSDFLRFEVQQAQDSWYEVSNPMLNEPALLVSMNDKWNGTFINYQPIPGNVFANSFLIHRLDTVPGASGSPLVQHGKVVAVHLGSINRNNIAVIFDKRKEVDVSELDLSIIRESQLYATIISSMALVVSIVNTLNTHENNLKNRIDRERDGFAERSNSLGPAEKDSIFQDDPRWPKNFRYYSIATNGGVTIKIAVDSNTGRVANEAYLGIGADVLTDATKARAREMTLERYKKDSEGGESLAHLSGASRFWAKFVKAERDEAEPGLWRDPKPWMLPPDAVPVKTNTCFDSPLERKCAVVSDEDLFNRIIDLIKGESKQVQWLVVRMIPVFEQYYAAIGIKYFEARFLKKFAVDPFLRDEPVHVILRNMIQSSPEFGSHDVCGVETIVTERKEVCEVVGYEIRPHQGCQPKILGTMVSMDCPGSQPGEEKKFSKCHEEAKCPTGWSIVSRSEGAQCGRQGAFITRITQCRGPGTPATCDDPNNIIEYSPCEDRTRPVMTCKQVEVGQVVKKSCWYTCNLGSSCEVVTF